VCRFLILGRQLMSVFYYWPSVPKRLVYQEKEKQISDQHKPHFLFRQRKIQ